MANAFDMTPIADARQQGRAYPTGDELAATLPDAYENQQSLLGLLVPQIGEIGGYKLAVNAKPQMAHFGVDEPVSAALFASEIMASPASVDPASFQTFCIEPEIAAIMGPGIEACGADASDTDIARAIAAFAPAIEIIDMRNANLADTSLSTAVSLNVFNHGCVLGPERLDVADLELGDMTACIVVDGQTVQEATDNAPQHPLAAVKWLAAHLHGRGLHLKEGMVVLCGTHVPMYRVPADAGQVSIEMTGLGKAALSVQGA